MPTPLPEAELAALVALFNQRPRLLYREIAVRTGRTLDNISWWSGELIARGLIARRFKMGKVPVAAVQIAHVQEIAAAREVGQTWREIGSGYGVTPQAVHNYYTRHADQIRE